MPMLAPRRTPPWRIEDVISLYICINETGPVVEPPEVDKISFFGRKREKANPVPPPDL